MQIPTPRRLPFLRPAPPLGIEINIAPAGTGYDENIFGALISYPSSEGQIRDIEGEISQIKAAGGMAIVASDLLALACLEPPGKFGADIVLGSAQIRRCHLAMAGHTPPFMQLCRPISAIPGRLVGVSKDSAGRMAYRLALQTREQHIRREKKRLSISAPRRYCLAVIAGFYAVWHGPEGLKQIAAHSHRMACMFAASMRQAGRTIRYQHFSLTQLL